MPTYILRSKGTVYVLLSSITYIGRCIQLLSTFNNSFLIPVLLFTPLKGSLISTSSHPTQSNKAPLNSSNTPKVAKTHASERRILKFSNPPKPLSEPHSHSDTRNLPRAFTYKPCKAPSFTYTLQMNVGTPTFYLPTYPLSSSNTPTHPPMAA